MARSIVSLAADDSSRMGSRAANAPSARVMSTGLWTPGGRAQLAAATAAPRSRVVLFMVVLPSLATQGETKGSTWDAPECEAVGPQGAEADQLRRELPDIAVHRFGTPVEIVARFGG